MQGVTRTRRTPVVCGIDIGSTNTKTVALTGDSTVVARVQRPTPRSISDLSVDADQLRRMVEGMLLELCGSRYVLAAACTVGVGEDGILVDDRGAPRGPALTWFDPRRARLFGQMQPFLRDEPAAGVADDAARTMVGWSWARQEGQVRDAAAWVALTDHVGAWWSGRPFMSDTLAARTAAWNGHGRHWIDERVVLTLGDERLLPPVVATGALVGDLRSAELLAADVVAPDAVVVAGGHDHPVGGWAIDQVDSGAILDSMGTAEVVVGQSPDRLDRTDTIDVAPGIRQPGTSVLCVEELTRNIEWASLDPDVGAALRALVSGDAAPDGSLHGDAFIAGVRGGVRPRYALDAPAAPGSRASAVLGALARLGTSALDDVASVMPAGSVTYVAGGWSRATGWLAIKEQISGRELRPVREPEVSAIGAAMLAAAAIGWDVSADAVLGTGGH